MMMIRDIITNLSVPFYNAEIMGIGRELWKKVDVSPYIIFRLAPTPNPKKLPGK